MTRPSSTCWCGWRAAFATLAGLAVHNRTATDRQFVRFLPLFEQASVDDRNFVKKAVNWALRQIGKRNRALNRAAIAVAERLAVSPAAAARWVGKDALRELTAATVQARLARRDLMQVLPQIDTSRIKPHT